MGWHPRIRLAVRWHHMRRSVCVTFCVLAGRCKSYVVQGFYLQKLGIRPPVKMTGYGNATPATWPSISNRTSRNGPWPKVIPGRRAGRTHWRRWSTRGSVNIGRDSNSVCITQNSSCALPEAKSSAHALTALRGNVMSSWSRRRKVIC